MADTFLFMLLCLWSVLQYNRKTFMQKTLKEDFNLRLCAMSVATQTVICGVDVRRWQPWAEWPFDRRSLQSSHQRRSWVSQSEPSAHRCTLLSPAYSCRCPSEGASEEGKKEQEWMVCLRQRVICVEQIYACIFLSYSFRGVCVWRRIFLVTIIHICHLRGMRGKNHCVCCD